MDAREQPYLKSKIPKYFKAVSFHIFFRYIIIKADTDLSKARPFELGRMEWPTACGCCCKMDIYI